MDKGYQKQVVIDETWKALICGDPADRCMAYPAQHVVTRRMARKDVGPQVFGESLIGKV